MLNTGVVLNGSIEECVETFDEYIDRLAAQIGYDAPMIPMHHVNDWQGDRFEDECPCYYCSDTVCTDCDIYPFAS